MIVHLARLNVLRQQIEQAGVFEKARLAGEIGEASYHLALIMAQRILKLEEEVQRGRISSSKASEETT